MRRLLIIFILCLSLTSQATQYYIAPTGNNTTGTGAIGNPWLTLFKACSTVTTPGDTIHVTAGTYTETAQCVLAPGVHIYGEGVTSIIKSTLSATFTEIISLRSATEGTAGNQTISFIKMDGNALTTSWAICVVARKNVEIHNCNFIDFKETAVNFSGINDPLQPGPGGVKGPPTIYATGNSFHDNTVYNCSSNSIIISKYGRGNLQIGGQSGFLCYNNDIQQPQRVSSTNDDIGWPIKMANEGHIKDCQVFNNTLKRAPIAATHGSNENWNFSFEMWNIEGLTFHDNILQGEVDIVNCTKGSSAYGLKFYNNTSSLPAISAFQAYALRMETNEMDNEVYSNTIYNLNSFLVYSPKDYHNPGDSTNFGLYVKRNYIHNNLCYNMGVTGGTDMALHFDNVDVNPQCFFDSLRIDHNTFVAVAGAAAPFFGVQLPGYNGGNTKNLFLRNNHIEGFSLNPVIITQGTNIDYCTIQNNNYYNNGSSSYSAIGGLPSHYTNTGNLTVAPNFGANYVPNVGSPLINAGNDGTDIGYTGEGGTPPPPPPPAAGIKFHRKIKM